MKRSLCALLVFLVAMVSMMTICNAVPYDIVRLTNNLVDDTVPQISANGHVAWVFRDYPNVEILLYDGASTTRLSGNTYDDTFTKISANGHVAWVFHDFPNVEIFYYDGTTTTMLGSYLHLVGPVPDLNANGHVVWNAYDGSDGEIFLYDGTSTTQLTNNDYDDYNPQISDNGNIVWYAYVSLTSEIFFYDGMSIIQLTDNNTNDGNFDINADGHVVWSGTDGSDGEIFLYDGTTTTQLTNNDYYDYIPAINASGHVVWKAYDGPWGSDPVIFLYDGTTTTQVTNNCSKYGFHRINDQDQVVWVGPDGSDNEIFLHDGTSTIQLTENDFPDRHPQINANGYVVWESDDGFDREILLAFPVSQNKAAFSVPSLNGLKPFAVTFTCLSYGDVDAWSWDFNNDGIEDSTEQNPSHTYSSSGTYTVTLAVSGSWGSDVVIKNDYISVYTPAYANFSSEATNGFAPLTVAFQNLSSGDIVTWSWDFDNDGVEDSTAQSPSYTYNTSGLYTVSLTASGPGGTDTETKTDYIHVTESGGAPIIDKIKPLKGATNPREPGTVLRIIGSGFGEEQGDSEVHIGPKTYGPGHRKIKGWSDNRIKMKIPKYKCEWFKGGDFRKRKIWVTVDSVDSNTKRTGIFKPDTCP
jgi:PKD repeat protein